ncbi:hypothetical protein EDF38_1315 [Frigoribacterium sp. PhB160]|uniref:hypothetical protein n=1 Tax=Frigoribacterium sp. PhB160 TaxID=2485192 RepID=UPI000F48C5B2|nr:hypothetical protein [Frigoribacterium sp. PhB160]ROS62212.1 hypothetical protein EDF38_1315 [Frigoribacterium sp. PhB160]
MAADSYGPKGEPQFAGSGASADAEDLTLLGEFAADVGNNRVGTTAERDAATAAGEAYDGLTWWDTTLRRRFQRVGTSWRPAGALMDGDLREGTTAANGVVGVGHSLGAVPRAVLITGTGRGAVPGELTYIVTAKTELIFNVNVYRNGSPFANNPVGFHWLALA